MSLAFERSDSVGRAVQVVRAGIIARDICRRGARGEVAAVFERSLYWRIGDDFICIGEPAIGNGPTTLIVAARVTELGVRQGLRAIIGNERITIGDLLFDFRNCATWRTPNWPAPLSSATLRTTCVMLAQRAAAESPADSLARAAFGDDDTPLARIARPRIARFASLMRQPPASSSPAKAGDPVITAPSELIGRRLLDAPLSRGMTREGVVHDLIGLGYGLTPSGDDFLIGALTMLDALEQTNMHAALGHAVVAAADRSSPLSASFLRAAADGHVGENVHTMIAAILTGDADAAVAAAARIGHTSGWDALVGAVVTVTRMSEATCGATIPGCRATRSSGLRQDYRC
ncbi:MAG: DUF2877 domain-containing protein [Hyphomicrobiales bacterium]|nr:DUF2877 domain-containing protein [Hyphomicrobiales bacterium]MBV8825869.1 DUF2877 domain-containing protein [Hyphomicrobiales bacterium]MBV9428634.1 DUF2877 domain-containing protein [Bradyrhizobiaceae bacterium]